MNTNMGVVCMVYRVADYENTNDFKIPRGGREIPTIIFCWGAMGVKSQNINMGVVCMVYWAVDY